MERKMKRKKKRALEQIEPDLVIELEFVEVERRSAARLPAAGGSVAENQSEPELLLPFLLPSLLLRQRRQRGSLPRTTPSATASARSQPSQDQLPDLLHHLLLVPLHLLHRQLGRPSTRLLQAYREAKPSSPRSPVARKDEPALAE
jgi:hypothetical protein